MNKEVFVQALQLSKTFDQNSTDPALDAVSFDVKKGEITGLVGPDGSGKTTLIRLIAGLLKKDSGELSVLGLDPLEDAAHLQSQIGYMPQKFGLYEDLSVLENLHLYADLQSIEKSQRDTRIQELLDFTSLSDFQHFLAKNLSGGMKQKLGLACALIKKPKLLLLDEPGVGVDPISRKELWAMVNHLLSDDRTKDIAVVWSTAYLDEAELCPSVILLSEGRILFHGQPQALSDRVKDRVFKLIGTIRDKRRSLQLALQQEYITDGVIVGDSIKLVFKEPIDPSHALPSLDFKQIEAENARLEAISPNFEDGFIHALKGNFDGESTLAKQIKPIEYIEGNLIEAKDLSKMFGTFCAANRVSFQIKRGEIFGFLGPNGAGKSTTFKMLCGLLKLTSGEAKVLGISLQSSSSLARSRIGYMSQKFSLYGDISVEDNLDFFAGVYGLSAHEKKQKITDMLKIFELEHYKNMPSKELPLGFKQRLSLACAVMHDPAVLFLDEPTSGIDPITRREFWNHIYAMVQKGMTIMVTTHFMDEAEFCDRIALIYKGRSIALGTPAQLMKQISQDTGIQEDTITMQETFIELIKRSETHAQKS
jgi:ABC-2 type transport system ATP-binding protein